MEQSIFNMTPLTSCMLTIKTELMCNDPHIKQRNNVIATYFSRKNPLTVLKNRRIIYLKKNSTTQKTLSCF